MRLASPAETNHRESLIENKNGFHLEASGCRGKSQSRIVGTKNATPIVSKKGKVAWVREGDLRGHKDRGLL